LAEGVVLMQWGRLAVSLSAARCICFSALYSYMTTDCL